MNYNIAAIQSFERELKRLAKKYPSMKSDYAGLLQELKYNPQKGTPIGNNCYKIRLAISSKGKGKSGGARVITFLYALKKTLYLLAIYDKSDIENISEDEIKSRLEGL